MSLSLAEKCYWVGWFRLLGLWSAFFKGFWLVRLLGLKVWNFVGLVIHNLILVIRLLSKFSSFANHCCICCFPINFQNWDWLAMNKWFIALYLRGNVVLGVWWLYWNASPSLCCRIKFKLCNFKKYSFIQEIYYFIQLGYVLWEGHMESYFEKWNWNRIHSYQQKIVQTSPGPCYESGHTPWSNTL